MSSRRESLSIAQFDDRLCLPSGGVTPHAFCEVHDVAIIVGISEQFGICNFTERSWRFRSLKSLRLRRWLDDPVKPRHCYPLYL